MAITDYLPGRRKPATTIEAEPGTSIADRWVAEATELVESKDVLAEQRIKFSRLEKAIASRDELRLLEMVIGSGLSSKDTGEAATLLADPGADLAPLDAWAKLELLELSAKGATRDYRKPVISNGFRREEWALPLQVGVRAARILRHATVCATQRQQTVTNRAVTASVDATAMAAAKRAKASMSQNDWNTIATSPLGAHAIFESENFQKWAINVVGASSADSLRHSLLALAATEKE